MTRARQVLVAAILLGLACGDDLPSAAQDGTGTGNDETGDGDVTVPAMICVPGERVCGSGEVRLCADDGARWVLEPCDEDEICLDGACQADALVVATDFLQPATIGFMYSAGLNAAGGEPPYGWAVGSSRPMAGSSPTPGPRSLFPPGSA
ncbi:MAG: hypothetical protein AB1Z98_39180 [Nannocystaceae bacterium]